MIGRTIRFDLKARILARLTSLLALTTPAFAGDSATDPAPRQELAASAPFAGFESPYYVFQFGPGENWIEGVDPFSQDLGGHFAYMGQLAGAGVLVHGGPLDRGDGSFAMGVIRADSLDHAQEIMAQDPAVQAGVYELLALDRWIALAGSGDGIDAGEVRRQDAD